MPLKILIFNWRDLAHPWAGGAEVFLHQVARRWVNYGHQVSWFCGRHRGQSARERVEGIEIIRRGGIYSVYLQAARYYLTHLRGEYDILFDSANGIPFFTPLFSSIPQVLLVHHVHHEVFFRELPWHLAHVANLMERFGMSLVYRNRPCVTVSESSRHALVRLGFREKQISIIHNGVDRTLYRPGPESEQPLILFVGRLRYYKSVDVALRALPLVLDVVPNVCFSIVGEGEADPSLRGLARELGVEGHVRFHGYVSAAEKVRLMQRAHVVVNPSMKEGWGLTVLEANACRTPVVAADVPGLRDSVQDGQTGLLVPYGDSQGMAEAVQTLLTNRGERERMARNGLNWAAQFDWDRSARQCLELFERYRDERSKV